MKSRNRKIFVGLAGGLGNQLFQIATAMSLTSGKVIVLECLGNPRGANRKPDSELLKFPDRVEFHPCREQHLILGRIFSLLLSMAVTRNYLNKLFITRVAIYVTSGLLLSFHLKRFILPRVGNGTGFDSTLRSKNGNLLIGYFQTDQHIQQAPDPTEIRQVKIRLESSYMMELENKINSNGMNMIHVRLGDYENEKDFGVLNSNYYKTAIQSLAKSKSSLDILLFSDEPESAIKKLPISVLDKVIVVEVKGVSAAETLELMRKCKNFVIANSSLSWWGAYLSESVNKIIIAPTPWFVNAPYPKFLIPKEWTLINRNGHQK